MSMDNLGGQQPAVPSSADRSAKWSLYTGIATIFTCGLAGIPAIILGLMGLKSPAHKSQAIAGIVLGTVGILLIVPIGCLAAIAVPSFVRAREISRRNACQENLSRIDGAKQQWALEKNMEPTDTAAWDDLVGDTGYLARMPVCPSGGTYAIGPVNESPTCSHTPQQFPHVLRPNSMTMTVPPEF